MVAVQRSAGRRKGAGSVNAAARSAIPAIMRICGIEADSAGDGVLDVNAVPQEFCA